MIASRTNKGKIQHFYFIGLSIQYFIFPAKIQLLHDKDWVFCYKMFTLKKDVYARKRFQCIKSAGLQQPNSPYQSTASDTWLSKS